MHGMCWESCEDLSHRARWTPAFAKATDGPFRGESEQPDPALKRRAIPSRPSGTGVPLPYFTPFSGSHEPCARRM
jgi:hypothetical protein